MPIEEPKTDHTEEPEFYRDDLQAFYDMQIVQLKDKGEALAALKKKFKIKEKITVTPTGEVRVPGVTDDPDPPSSPPPPPMLPPGAAPPGGEDPKEEPPGSQLGKENPSGGAKKPPLKKESIDEAGRKLPPGWKMQPGTKMGKALSPKDIVVGDIVNMVGTAARAGTSGKVIKASRVNLEVEVPYMNMSLTLTLRRDDIDHVGRGNTLHPVEFGESEDEPQTRCLPLIEAVERLSKLRERETALAHASLYGRFHRLVNMRPREIREHLRSDVLRDTLQVTRKSKTEAIRLGKHAVEEALQLKSTPVEDWTPAMWEWCDRIVKFIERTRRNGAPHVNENGKLTRKTLALRTWGHDPMRESAMELDEFAELYEFDPSLALRMVDATATTGPVALIEAGDVPPSFSVLKANRAPLSEEERESVGERLASPAVWRADVDGETHYVVNTHRAYIASPTLEGALGRAQLIKSTS